MNQLLFLLLFHFSRIADAMIPYRKAIRQYLVVLTLQNRADAADGIGEILRATVHGKFEENNQHTNMISIMIPLQTL